jgi:hypothetical protein
VTRVTRVRGLAGLAVASVVLLTGCGAVPDLNPGVAARIGDETVTTRHVADTAKEYCAAVETQLTKGQAVAGSALNTEVAGALVLRSAIDQFADDEGVTAGSSLQQQEDQLAAQIAKLSTSQKKAVRSVYLANYYAAAVFQSVGEKGGATGDAAVTAGQKEFAGWLDDEDVRIDPRFGVDLSENGVSTVDTGLSYAISSTAKKASAKTADTAYAAALPQTQRCG